MRASKFSAGYGTDLIDILTIIIESLILKTGMKNVAYSYPFCGVKKS